MASKMFLWLDALADPRTTVSLTTEARLVLASDVARGLTVGLVASFGRPTDLTTALIGGRDVGKSLVESAKLVWIGGGIVLLVAAALIKLSHASDIV